MSEQLASPHQSLTQLLRQQQTRPVNALTDPLSAPPPSSLPTPCVLNVNKYLSSALTLKKPLQSDPLRHWWKMTDRVKVLQAEGNALYGDGRYDAARASYTQAIALLTAGDESASNSAHDAPDAASWKALTASQLYSNRAQTAVQERDFAAALHDATLALKHNPKNEKALLRTLVALENLERFEAALQLVDGVLDHGEKNAPTVFQYCVAARRRLRKNLVRDREVAASEVKQMGKMVHDKQQLRINFGCVVITGTSRAFALEERR
ncbi:unnamed protein product [Phytophthora lilii]|uniref:Unnamed protein product n=1 Tax=Phytophthora lilii TaxID=2077276 RepID=A0A9W6TGS8_9STRA|nr:unnamed protein product [Phytophthora lilii]